MLDLAFPRHGDAVHRALSVVHEEPVRALIFSGHPLPFEPNVTVAHGVG